MEIFNTTNILIFSAILLVVILAIVFFVKKSKKSSKPKTTKSLETGFESLEKKLRKTHTNLFDKITELLKIKGKVDEDLMDDLEDILIQADIGIETTTEIMDRLRKKIRDNKITETDKVHTELKNIIIDIMKTEYSDTENRLANPDKKPFVILFIGVNGVGKTTTIAKMAERYRKQGKKVMMIAADTFRAAAIDQLSIWAERTGATISKQKEGSDPSAVVFDGLKSAVSRQYDVVLIDTAGRQHTKANLMKELSKISRTIKKVIPDAPHEALLVVDATTGQNAIMQAKIFNEATTITGLVLTKLDGTAKGGIVIGIKHQLNIPVKLIGVGEKSEDLRDFKIDEFVQAII